MWRREADRQSNAHNVPCPDVLPHDRMKEWVRGWPVSDVRKLCRSSSVRTPAHTAGLHPVYGQVIGERGIAQLREGAGDARIDRPNHSTSTAPASLSMLLASTSDTNRRSAAAQ
jgi:hypothetical protein